MSERPQYSVSPASAFTSFHYQRDHWRCQQVRGMGVVEGQPILDPSDWEAVRRRGDAAIQQWIDRELAKHDLLLVLVGAETAARPWVQYEIDRALELGLGVLGVAIHRLKDQHGRQDPAGANPFTAAGHRRRPLIPVYDSPFTDSKSVYEHIQRNLPGWLARAASTVV